MEDAFQFALKIEERLNKRFENKQRGKSRSYEEKNEGNNQKMQNEEDHSGRKN